MVEFSRHLYAADRTEQSTVEALSLRRARHGMRKLRLHKEESATRCQTAGTEQSCDATTFDDGVGLALVH